jgi:hypothetical protein
LTANFVIFESPTQQINAKENAFVSRTKLYTSMNK